MKICLVTGAAGFIGSHLVESLLSRGYWVLGLDNLITGIRKNLEIAFGYDKFKFIETDVLKWCAGDEKIDHIFHLASPASVVDYQKYPKETALVNSIGTLNILDVAVKNRATFLFTSTSEIYGDPKEHPQKESYWGNVNPNGVRSCYDESKRFGEMLTMLYVRKYSVNARIVRIFNTYGPRMRPDDGRVVSNFINQAITGEDVTIYGLGNQTRSFCYVSDLVEGITKAMFENKTSGEVFNLGNPEEYKVEDLAKKIITLTGSFSKIRYENLPEDDPQIRKPDITKAKSQLNWEPAVKFDEGLKKTIAYYKSL